MYLYLSIITFQVPVLETCLLLLILLCSETHASKGRSKYPSYTIPGNHSRKRHSYSSSHSGHSSTHHVYTHDLLLQGLEDNQPTSLSHVHRNEFLMVKWVNSSVHEISISWNFSGEYNSSGFIKSSVVACITDKGRFTSDRLSGDVRNYTFSNLNPGYLYTVCVYVEEAYGENNDSTFQHSKCAMINTIDYVRRDSVIICLATLGYYALMALIGYTQWRRRMYAISNNIKKRSRTNAQDGISDTQSGAMRWQDLAEKENLVQNNPGCSIEYNDT